LPVALRRNDLLRREAYGQEAVVVLMNTETLVSDLVLLCREFMEKLALLRGSFATVAMFLFENELLIRLPSFLGDVHLSVSLIDHVGS
jgi:hypothetical protein